MCVCVCVCMCGEGMSFQASLQCARRPYSHYILRKLRIGEWRSRKSRDTTNLAAFDVDELSCPLDLAYNDFNATIYYTSA